MEPKNFSRFMVLIGTGDLIPPDALTDEETFVYRIDPAATPSELGKRESIMPNEWGDVLRLPVSGAYSHDAPELRAASRVETHWIGNAALFPTVYDLIVAASQHRDDSTYSLARRTPEGLKLLPRGSNYHPLSGHLPGPGTYSEAEGHALLAIMLGVIQSALAMEQAGVGERARPDIYPNDYATYSVSTAPMVLLISYYGLDCTGQGKVQDKFDSDTEFRHLVYKYMDSVMVSYMARVKAQSPQDCARKLAKVLAPNQDLQPPDLTRRP